MMNAKVKVSNNNGKKSGGLPMTTGQAIKVTGPNSQGMGLISGNQAMVGGANMQHPSHAKKLTEGKIASGKPPNLSQHKFTNASGTNGQPSGGVMHVDLQKKTAFEISRNQIGSRGRSLGASSPNGTAPRRNIQTFQMDQQQQQPGGQGIMVQPFSTEHTVVPNATNQHQQMLINTAANGKGGRNQRANSTMPGRQTHQGGYQQPQFGFESGKGGPNPQMKGSKYVNNQGSFSQANTPLGGAQTNMNANTQQQAIKRIRDSRQRGNKSMSMAVNDPQNQLMQAYINQTVTMNQKQSDFVGPGGQIRATEPMRIRAHSDLKKTGIQIGVKIQGVQNSREHLNQTTVLAGNPQNASLTHGIQQFHSRGNSISGTNMGLGVPGQNQKRSQSVDKNAPNFHHFNQSQNFAASAQFGPNAAQNNIAAVNQSQQAHQTGAGAKDPKNQHFIHDAIERKIERFSRQRNRGGIHMSQGASAANPGSVYTQSVTGQFSSGQVGNSALNGAGSKGNIQQQTNAGPNQPASRAFKAQQKMQHQQHAEDAMFDRQKKKNGGQPGTANGQGQILMRGEIMSAGQANLNQRKLMTANQGALQEGSNLVDESAGARNNNYLSNMLDGYQANNSKKAQRGGTRGGNQSSNTQAGYNQSAMHGVPTGPLLAQKVVQLPKQSRVGAQASNTNESEEQKYRQGKVKLDRLKKDGGQVDSPGKGKSGKLTIIEVENGVNRNSPERGEHRNKTKIAAAIQMQRQQQHTGEEEKNSSQNPQLQGQGQQVLSKPLRKEKIAVISLTTAKIDLRKNGDLAGGEIHSEKQTMEPDEQAYLHGSKKRLVHMSPESARSHPDDYDQYSLRQNRDGKKRSKMPNKSHRAGSNGSVTVSMRDECIMHMSVNSVTDGNFILHEGDSKSQDSNDHFSIKKQMIRYLSRVADRNKPLFVFNQKINLGGDSSDDDTGTPSFSLVALIDK